MRRTIMSVFPVYLLDFNFSDCPPNDLARGSREWILKMRHRCAAPCQVTCLLVSHCFVLACIECGANISPSQFLLKPLSCHESWSNIPQTGPKISSSLIHHVLIFLKGAMTKKLTHVTHMHWSASSNPRSVLSYFHQSRDGVSVTCHDVMTQVFRVWWWPSLHKRPLPWQFICGPPRH